MYKCGEGHLFDEPVMLMEDFFDRGEELYGCPVCSDGYDEVDDEDD